jgi:Yip1 domain
MDQLSPSAPPAATPPGVESSLLSRLLNVFVSPGEVFDEVKASPGKSSNWVVPLVLSILVGMVGAYIMFSQPRVLQSVKDGMDAQFEKSIKAGAMKRQDADRIEEMTLKIMKYGAPAGAIFANVIALFLTAAVVFLVGRFAFKAPVNFMPVLEVTGLSNMVNLLGAIVMVLLVVIYGGLGMTPGPILLVGHFDPQSKLHLILSNLNIIALWYVAVLGLGLSRLTGTSWLKSTLWTFCLWALFIVGPPLAMSLLKPPG